MELKNSKNEVINFDMKIEDVENYGDFIDFLIIKATKNIAKYSNYSLEEIFKENYSFDSFHHTICKNYTLKKEEHYSDALYLQTQLQISKTKLIRQVEYDIYLVM